MTDFVLAINKDGRLEAFYIENNTVKHIWQLSPSDKLSWSNPGPLFGGNNPPLDNATTLGAYTDADGYIQVVAQTTNGSYQICYQTADGWQGWVSITQS